MRFTPTSLFGRFVLIIVVPVIVLQLIMAYVFYQRHWDNVTKHMETALINELSVVIRAFQKDPEKLDNALLISSTLQLRPKYLENQKLNTAVALPIFTDRNLDKVARRINSNIHLESIVHYIGDKSDIIANFQLPNGVLKIEFSSKRIQSPTTWIFILWMIGTATLLLIISIIFMKNQVRSILRLATAAEKLGKGQEIPKFNPSGAKEIRTAGKAFVQMKRRIERQIKHRTELLAHISHDLRTPLTRLKLQTAMLKDKKSAEDLENDISEMEKMIEGYLNFAKGEGNEKTSSFDVIEDLKEIIDSYNDPRITTKFKFDSQTIHLREGAFKRAISNLIGNALQYCKNKVELSASKTEEYIHIVVDDDGKGIPENKMAEALKPFSKLNKKSTGYGLGLAIVKTIVHIHGGKIRLAKSPLGGLRVIVRIPF